MENRLKDKKVVITGGNKGIGRAIAFEFAQHGAQLLITYHRDEKSAEEVVEELTKTGALVKCLCVDLAQEQDREKLTKESYAFLSDVDILVNNAGIATRQDFLELTQEEVHSVFEINLFAPFFLSQKFARAMALRQQQLISLNKALKDYSIINISSISKEVVTPGLSHYEASKAALSQLTKSMSRDLARYMIRVNDIAPGIVPTNINKKQREQMPDLWQKRIAETPLKRAGDPLEVAQAVLFIAQNKWMSGSTLTIDGGRSCNWSGEYR